MHFDMAGVNHQPFQIGVIGHLGQQAGPVAVFLPAGKTAVGGVPVSVIRGQVAPGCAGAEDPEYGVDKAAVVLCGASHFTGAAGQVWGDGFPGAVGDVVAAVGRCGVFGHWEEPPGWADAGLWHQFTSIFAIWRHALRKRGRRCETSGTCVGNEFGRAGNREPCQFANGEGDGEERQRDEQRQLESPVPSDGVHPDIYTRPPALANANQIGTSEGLTYGEGSVKSSVSILAFGRTTQMTSAHDIERPHYPLHPYQRQVLYDLLEFLMPARRPISGPGPRAIAHMPTGAGKTRLACHAACHLLNQRDSEGKILIWMAASEELCDQAAEGLTEAWAHLGNRAIRVQRFWGNATELDYEPGILVTGLAKLYAASKANRELLFALASRTAAVVFDEAHQAIADTYQFVIRQLLTREPPLLGLTATPGRKALLGDEDDRLADLFSFNKVTIAPQGYPDPVTYLISQGYLADPRFTPVNLQSTVQVKPQSMTGDYTENALRNIGDDPVWRDEIVRVTSRAMQNHRRVIVFCPSVESAQDCTATLERQGVRVANVIGTTPPAQRRSIIDAFRTDDRQPMALLNYGVLTAGFDAPRTSCVVIARPTTSLVLYSQMAGRAMRGPLSGGNRRCQIYTVVDTQLPGFGSVAQAFQHWEELWSPT